MLRSPGVHRLPRPLSRRARVATGAGALAVLLTVGLVALVGGGPDPERAAVAVPAAYQGLIATAATACPLLSPPRLAAQIMANTGFDPHPTGTLGRDGVAGLTDEAWQQWVPWPNADRGDADASITALAHQMCDLAGQLRLARTTGEPWHLALAAHRTTLDLVIGARGVPVEAAGYVARVDRYALVYADTLPAAPAGTGPTATPTPTPSRTPTPSPTPSPTPTLTPTATASPEPPPVTGPTGRISGFNGKCLHVAYTNPADGTQIEMYACNNGPAESMTMASDGTIRALGKCLGIENGRADDGARVLLFTCDGSPGQQWRYTVGQDIVNPRADRCLDVVDFDPDNGAPVQIWQCSGNANQKWSVPGG